MQEPLSGCWLQVRRLSFRLIAALSVLVAPASPAWPGPGQQPRATGCDEWRACRQLALDAAARGDYEGFHDLAWRAVQTAPPADPDLMYLLARAQSLSGRPGDALVMLRRLAEMGVASDAAVNDDFRRVRGLPGWPAVREAIARAGEGEAAAPEPVRSAPPTNPSDAAPAVKPAAAPAPAAPTPVVAEPPTIALAVETLPVEEAARFSTEPFVPGGLAYDAVSRRIVFGDAGARRVRIVADGARHTVNLVSSSSAGFHDVLALEIDARRGDLWVVSAAPDGTASALHKLQLVSGRPLARFEAEPGAGRLRLVDVSVTGTGRVIALDREGRRVMGLAPGAPSLTPLVTLGLDEPASLTVAGERVAYVAHRDGVAHLDLTTRVVRAVDAPAGVDLGGFEWIRWHRESLVGIQAIPGGGRRLLRLVLGARGRSVTAAAVLNDPIGAGAGPACAALVGDDLYYLVRKAEGGQGRDAALVEVAVERLRLPGRAP